MMPQRDLAARLEAYGDWRRRVASSVARFHEWLKRNELADAQIDLRVSQLLERLHQDKLTVAFVAEFSRGKSELINAIFFADFGRRLLPSSAGRTTMCPTELLHDPTQAPSIRLLPIDTRLSEATVAELRNYADEWITIALDLASPARMSDALSRVSQTRRVPAAEARSYCLHGEAGEAEDTGAETVEIPAWRHAIINFPHPLLQQGLVVLDTPGLNAIGAEPELTLNLLPNAHAVLFLLAADAGVSKTDLEVWTRHLAGDDPVTKAGRIVVLNKIDGLWDDLRPVNEINAEIERQVRASASLLDVPPAQVFAVSAQKALLAKIHGDDALLARSRLPALERALSGKLIPAKRDIIGAATRSDALALAGGVRAILDARMAGISEQLSEFVALRGKNLDVIEHMMERIREEKDAFERGLARYTALRNVFTQQTNELFDMIGLPALRTNAARTRERIEESSFTKGVREAMGAFFARIGEDFDRAQRQASEIHEMMNAMYVRFANEHGLEPFMPPPFSMLKYRKEIQRLEQAYNTNFNTLWNMVSKAKFSLMRRFFDTVASRARHVYDIANRDVETWLRAVMSPLETQVREHQLQLRRRLESIRRIHQASEELEERIAELEQARDALLLQLEGLSGQLAAIDDTVETPDAPRRVADGEAA